MKIGLVLPDLPQYSETFFNYKIKGLQQSGFEVIVFSGKKHEEKFSYEHKSSYPVYEGNPFKQLISLGLVLTLTFLKNPGRAKNLYSLERKDGRSTGESLKVVYLNSHILNYDLDWLHFGFATMSVKRENVAKAMGSKMGVSFRGYDINIYPLKNPGCYEKLWRNVDKVHSISNYLYDKGVELGLSKKKPFTKITPSIDTSVFRMKENPGKIDSSKITFLTVGRLNWIKDYETAIYAMKILKESGINFIYNIIGMGNELERLKFAVHQCGLEDRIFFLGKVGHEKVMETMFESDIYLQTSLQEGFCVSVLEAQSAGMLCVVSDADGLKENVADGESGWIVKRRDPAAFAEKITEVINLPEEVRQRVSINARKRVEKEFRIEDQREKFYKFFLE